MSSLSENTGYRAATIALTLSTIVATALWIVYYPVGAFWVLILSLLAVAFLWPLKDLLPVALFTIIWFVPGQTAPGGIFQDYRMLRWIRSGVYE